MEINLKKLIFISNAVTSCYILNRVQQKYKESKVGYGKKNDAKNQVSYLEPWKSMTIYSNNIDKELENVVKWLSPRDNVSKHHSVARLRTTGTCDWFFSHEVFTSWLNLKGTLWLYGRRE